MKILVGILLAIIFSAPVVARSQTKTDSGTAQQNTRAQWDHKKHIRLCATADTKRCTLLSIPAGIKGILGIVRTKSTLEAPQTFVIIGRKNSYLCASGIGGQIKLRCQRLPLDVPLNELTPERAQAQLQNTLTLLRANSGTAPHEVVGNGEGADCDIETGVCRTEGDGGDGSDTGSGGYSDIGDGDADTATSYQEIADDFISNDFASGMGEFLANARTKPQMKCSMVVSQCRETCSGLQNLEYSGCAALGAAVGAVLTPVIGGATAVYCSGKAYVAGEQCKQGCNTPQVICTAD